jgi:hypothetical protein
MVLQVRTICWFSCGAASAIATKLTLAEFPDALVVRIVIDNEHEDNGRFANDCSKWFGKEIIEIRSDKYKDAWDVWEKTKYLNGVHGARCTVELKKLVRRRFEDLDDIQIFGYTYNETNRAERFVANNPEIQAKFPLIYKKLTKQHCFYEIQQAGIELPMMYRMGYHNANCVGCVKGGAGYWNKIRVDFPDEFERMAKLEETLGRSVLNGRTLRELHPKAGSKKDLILPDCGLFCGENS